MRSIITSNDWRFVIAPVTLNIFGLLLMTAADNLLTLDHSKMNEMATFLSTASVWSISVFVLITTILIPMLEEWFFRSLTWTFLQRFFSHKVTFHFVALFFVACHLDVLSMVGLLPFSYYLSWLRRNTGGIGAGIFAHGIFNMTGLMIMLAQLAS